MQTLRLIHIAVKMSYYLSMIVADCSWISSAGGIISSTLYHELPCLSFVEIHLHWQVPMVKEKLSFLGNVLKEVSVCVHTYLACACLFLFLIREKVFKLSFPWNCVVDMPLDVLL